MKSRERRLLRGLQDYRITHSQSGSQFPRLHQEGEVPRNDLSTDADGFMSRIGEEVPGNRDNFSVVLVSPSSIIAESVDGGSHIDRVGHTIRLAVVQSLEGGQEDTVAFHQVGQLVQELSAPGGVHLPPRGVEFEGSTGSL